MNGHSYGVAGTESDTHQESQIATVSINGTSQHEISLIECQALHSPEILNIEETVTSVKLSAFF